MTEEGGYLHAKDWMGREDQPERRNRSRGIPQKCIVELPFEDDGRRTIQGDAPSKEKKKARSSRGDFSRHPTRGKGELNSECKFPTTRDQKGKGKKGAHW